MYPRRLKQYLEQETQKRFPPDLYDLIDKLLKLNPKERLTVQEALDHDLFKKYDSDPECRPENIP